MRIQNNITAMNTHRQYTINNDNVAKAAEKLSSGYRINRAGDDAAGLAISEKMRSQIRGLNMATKNSQDAISLVQTAEGALQETHAMLQRMNELAVQAATGTNEDLDRTALAKEFEQLKREINDVAEQTNFNNMKILDGSLSYEGFQRSAATAGVTNTVTDSSVSGEVPEAPAKSTLVAGTDQVTSSGKVQGEFSVKITDEMVANYEAKQTYSIEFTIDGETYRVDSAALSGKTPGTDKVEAKDVAALFNTKTVTVKNSAGDNVTLTASVASGSDTVKFQTTASTAETTKPDLILSGGVTATLDTKHGDEAVALDVSGIKDEKQIRAATNATNLITFDQSKIKQGDTFTIGDRTYQVVQNDAKVNATNGKLQDADGNDLDVYAVKWNGKTDDSSNFMSSLVAAVKKDTAMATSPAPKAIGDTLYITAAATGEAATEKVEFSYAVEASNDFEGRTNTIEFDIAKMQKGDTFTFKTNSGSSVDVTYNGESRVDFMAKVETAFADVKGAEVKGNAVILKDDKVDSITLADNASLPKTNAIRIQVGALENEQLAISIDSMNTAGLGLDDSHLTIAGNTNDQNIDEAGKAITAVRAAINKVSDQRATLGAMQNRLDHKIANLKVASENLSASESRIRDVDMAQEMTNFTKNNILSQASTAMLAQANALPQNVLSLLG